MTDQAKQLTIAAWIEDRINQIFLDLADAVREGEIDTSDMTPDEIASIPGGLFAANAGLISSWRAWVNRLRQRTT